MFQSENVIVTENEFDNIGSIQETQTQRPSTSSTTTTSATSNFHDYPINPTTSTDPKDAIIEKLGEELSSERLEKKALKEKLRQVTQRCAALRKRANDLKLGNVPKYTKTIVSREKLKRKNYSDAQIGNFQL